MSELRMIKAGLRNIDKLEKQIMSIQSIKKDLTNFRQILSSIVEIKQQLRIYEKSIRNSISDITKQLQMRKTSKKPIKKILIPKQKPISKTEIELLEKQIEKLKRH